MKKYIKPISDNINVATDEVMTTCMSIRIFGHELSTIDEYDLLITNSDEILANEDNVWDTLEDNLKP